MKAIFKTTWFFSAGVLLSAGAAAQRVAPLAYGNSNNVNYVRTWDAKAPQTDASKILITSPIDSFTITTQYLDGLGRPIQTVVKQLSPLGKDMVTPVVYDTFGREQYKYLPFAANSTGGNSSTTDGLFKLNPFQQDSAFYSNTNSVSPIMGQGETWLYSKTKFETSPLNRTDSVYAQGNNWIGASRGTAQQHLINTAADSVRIWIVTSTVSQAPTTSAMYAAGQLYKTVSIDEHSKQGVEYKDKEGHVVLKKMQLSNSPGTAHVGWLCTYYVYDDYGNLRFVLQPAAVESFLLAGSWSISNTVRDELCFYYGYDSRNRMIIKKVPGAGEVYMVYDAFDRLLMTQDANLHTSNKWLFTKYDQLNRPIMTGFYVNSTYTTVSAMQSYVDGQGLARYENYQTATFPLYSLNQSFPVVSYSDLLTITYYDDYSWAGWYGSYSSKDNTWDAEFATPSNTVAPYPQSLTQSSQTKGLTTGVWDNTGPGLLTASYYDDKARPIQTKSYNYTTGIDITTTQYAFGGQVLQTVMRHEKGGTNSQTHVLQTRFTYDNAQRLIETEKKLSSTIGSTTLSENWHTIATLQYDELGQLKKKGLAPDYGSSGLDTLSSTYNIRGWLTAINKGYITGTADAWFGMELGYDKDGYATFSNKQYNGNISGIIWRTKGDGEKRKYDFTYDAVNRLLKADFTQQAGSSWDVSAGIDYSMKMGDGSDPLTAYDGNGNIMKMWQKGWLLGGSVTIDSLIYKNNDQSNKLKYVRDGANDPNTLLGDFKESSTNNSGNLNSNTADYSYDNNGNLISDANKSISSITYNHLNLPLNIAVTSKGSIEYVYDNSGMKLKKVVHETGKDDKTTLYLSGFVYENDTLQLLQHEEGRIRLTSNTSSAYNGYAFDYFEKDHLGNVRVLLTEQRDTAAYPEASMETSNLGRDSLYYSKISDTRIQRSSVSGYPSNDTLYTNPNDWVAKVSGSGNKVGPGIVLKVMAGDKFNVRVSSWYKANGASPGTPVSPLNDLLTALISGISGSGKFEATALQSGTVLSDNVTSFLNSQTVTSGRPKAYLNWVLLDEHLNYVAASSGFEQVPAESVYGNGGGSPSVYVHQQSGVSIGKSGYLYVYVSNETPNIDVLFDNLQVTHIKGPLVEETHYYPFGLTMAGISSTVSDRVKNLKKFQEQLVDPELGLQWYQFRYRSYDPQIGRFGQIDPLSEKYRYNGIYVFSENKVTSHIELEGLESRNFNESNSPIIRALARDNVQKAINSATKNLSESGSAKISVGVGFSVDLKVGTSKLQAGINGPQASITVTPDAKLSGSGSLAGAGANFSSPIGSVGMQSDVGKVDYKGGKLTAASLENGTLADISKTAKDENHSAHVNIDPNEMQFGAGGKIGIVGFSIAVSPAKLLLGAIDVMASWFETAKSAADEKLPLSSGNRARFQQH